jgi:pantoate--beta-alanine ligase
MRGMLAAEPHITKIEYASVCDPETLDEIDEVRNEVLLAVAVRMGDIRLIDNVLVNL